MLGAKLITNQKLNNFKLKILIVNQLKMQLD